MSDQLIIDTEKTKKGLQDVNKELQEVPGSLKKATDAFKVLDRQVVQTQKDITKVTNESQKSQIGNAKLFSNAMQNTMNDMYNKTLKMQANAQKAMDKSVAESQKTLQKPKSTWDTIKSPGDFHLKIMEKGWDAFGIVLKEFNNTNSEALVEALKGMIEEGSSVPYDPIGFGVWYASKHLDTASNVKYRLLTEVDERKDVEYIDYRKEILEWMNEKWDVKPVVEIEVVNTSPGANVLGIPETPTVQTPATISPSISPPSPHVPLLNVPGVGPLDFSQFPVPNIDATDVFGDLSKIDLSKMVTDYIDKETEKINNRIKKKRLATADIITKSMTGFNGFISLLGAFGVKLDDTAQNVVNFANGAADIATGILKGDLASAINGVVKAVGALVNLFKGDGVGEAIDRERKMIEISEEMGTKIKKAEEKYHDTHTAVSTLMSDIIKEATVTADTYENYARRVGEIVLDMDRQRLSLVNFKKEMGEAWSALIDEAKKLGMEGSYETLSIIRNMKERGIEVAEIQQYLNEELKTGTEAFGKYLESFSTTGITEKVSELQEKLKGLTEGTQEYNDVADEMAKLQAKLGPKTEEFKNNFGNVETYAMGMFSAVLAESKNVAEAFEVIGPELDKLAEMAKDNGLELSGPLQEMMNTKQFVDDNKDLIERISATKEMLEALGNTDSLSPELFNQFQSDAKTHLDELVNRGLDAQNAYKLVAPELGKLLWYSQQQGYALDENTKKMVAEAEQHGVNMKNMIPPQERMVQLLETLVQHFGAELPDAIEETADVIGDPIDYAGKGAEKLNQTLDETGELFGDRLPKDLKGMAGTADEAFSNTVDSIQNMENETETWQKILGDVEDQIGKKLPDAVKNLDDEYTEAMTGNTIVKETEKWQEALEGVEGTMRDDLTDAAEKMDIDFQKNIEHVIVALTELQNQGDDVAVSFGQVQQILMTLPNGIEAVKMATAMLGIQVSDDLQERIDDLTEEIGNSHAAMSTYMADIIKDAEINEYNFGTYVNRTREILTDFLDGSLTLKQTQETMGDAFNALLDDAKRLGTEGSSEMVALLREVRAVGLEITEITDYVNDKLNDAVAALGTYISSFQETGDIAANWDFMQGMTLSTFSALEQQGHSFIEIVGMMQGQLTDLANMAKDNGLEISEGLQAMTDMAAFVEENDALATRIESTHTLMQSLGDAAFLTSGDFSLFQGQLIDQFDQIIASGGDSEMALRLLAPSLNDLVKYSESYGFTIDDNTQALIDQAGAQGLLADQQKTDAQVTNDLLLVIAETLGATIPDSLKSLVGDVNTSVGSIQGQTQVWKDGLGDVKDKIENELPTAIKNLDDKYAKAMTGNTIVKETHKWKGSLQEVEEILGKDLPATADSLDKKYKHVTGNIYDYLERTSKEGFISRMSFDQMVDEVVRVRDAYETLAKKKKRTGKEGNMLDDYRRQIQELSEAIRETAPTIENFQKMFREFQEELTGDIGVNSSMIQLAQELRAQGESFDEIDRLIESSLKSGSTGMAAWIEAIGPASSQIDEIRKLQKEYDDLAEKEKKSANELEKMADLSEQLNDLKAEANANLLDDQEALLNSQELLTAYFYSLQAEGKSVIEIMNIMGSSFSAMAGKSFTDEFGGPLGSTFENLFNLQQKMSENSGLIKGIEGLGSALHGMGDSMLYMTGETFGGFETAAVNAYRKLKDAGFDQVQALQLMAPILRDIESYGNEYGYALSSSISSLLDDAQANQLIKEAQLTETERLIDSNTHLADVMTSLAHVISGNEMRSMGAGIISAAGGYHGILGKDTFFRLHAGELVNVWTPEETRRIQSTPIHRMNLSDGHAARGDGDIVFEHITVQGENGEETVREFMTAIKGNKYGVQNLIRKVAQ